MENLEKSNPDKSGNPAKGVRLQGFKGFKLNRNFQILYKPTLKQQSKTTSSNATGKISSLLKTSSCSVDEALSPGEEPLPPSGEPPPPGEENYFENNTTSPGNVNGENNVGKIVEHKSTMARTKEKHANARRLQDILASIERSPKINKTKYSKPSQVDHDKQESENDRLRKIRSRSSSQEASSLETKRGSSHDSSSNELTPQEIMLNVSETSSHENEHQSRDPEHRSHDSEHQSRDSEHQSRDSENRSHDSEHRSRDSEHRSHDSEPRSRDSEHRSHDSEHRSRDSEHRSRDSEHRSRDSEHRSRDSEHRSRDSEHQSRDSEHRSHDSEHRSRDSEHRSRDSEHRSYNTHHNSSKRRRRSQSRDISHRRVRRRPREPHVTGHRSPRKSSDSNYRSRITSRHRKRRVSVTSQSSDDDEIMRKMRERRMQRSKSPETYLSKKKLRHSSNSKDDVCKNTSLTPLYEPIRSKQVIVDVGKNIDVKSKDKSQKMNVEADKLKPKSNSLVALASIGCWLGDDDDLEFEVKNIKVKHEAKVRDDDNRRYSSNELTFSTTLKERNVFDLLMSGQSSSTPPSDEADLLKQPINCDVTITTDSDIIKDENAVSNHDELSKKKLEPSKSGIFEIIQQNLNTCGEISSNNSVSVDYVALIDGGASGSAMLSTQKETPPSDGNALQSRPPGGAKAVHPAKKRYHEWFKTSASQESKNVLISPDKQLSTNQKSDEFTWATSINELQTSTVASSADYTASETATSSVVTDGSSNDVIRTFKAQYESSDITSDDVSLQPNQLTKHSLIEEEIFQNIETSKYSRVEKEQLPRQQDHYFGLKSGSLLPGQQSPESPLFCDGQDSPTHGFTMYESSDVDEMPPVDIRIPIDNDGAREQVDETSNVEDKLDEKQEIVLTSIPSALSTNELSNSSDASAVDENNEGRRRSARIKTKMEKKKKPISRSHSLTTSSVPQVSMETANKENVDLSSNTENVLKSLPLQQLDTNQSEETPPYYEPIEENIYLFEKKKSRARKEIRRMLCECINNDDDDGAPPCGDDCLNRLLMIECSARCPFADSCTNKRFQRRDYVCTEVFRTSWKGWGLRATERLTPGSLVMEYCGEVLDQFEFERRSQIYSEDNQQHFYFMALSQDEVIDATSKGNTSRFINHSCDPNCETQKWTVNGRLRVGFFTIRDVQPGEEITFDYQFERYGKEAQICYCGSSNCRGYLGKAPDDNDDVINTDDYKVKPTLTSVTFDREKDKKNKHKKKKVQEFKENTLENEINRLSEGLRSTKEVLLLSRLMVRSESVEERMMCLKVIRKSDNQTCLRSFLQFHGLPLIWSWMVDVSGAFSTPDKTSPDNVMEIKVEILLTLSILPITNKNILEDSKVLSMVKRWLEEESSVQEEKQKKSCDQQPINKEVKGEEEEKDSVETEMENTELCDVIEVQDENVAMEAENVETQLQKTEINNGNPELSKQVFLLTETLLSSWKDLKEIYRIPKRQKMLEKQPPCGDSEKCSEDRSSSQTSSPSVGNQGDSHQIEPMSRNDDQARSPHRSRGRSDRDRSRESDRYRSRDYERSRRSPPRSRWRDDDGSKVTRQNSNERDSVNKYSWLYNWESSSSSRLSREEHRRQFERDMRHRDEKKLEIKDTSTTGGSVWPQPAVTSTAPAHQQTSTFMSSTFPQQPASAAPPSVESVTFTPSGYSGNLIQINPAPVIPQPVIYPTSQEQVFSHLQQRSLNFVASQPLVQPVNPLQPPYITNPSQGQPISVIGVPPPPQVYNLQSSLMKNPYQPQVAPMLPQPTTTVDSGITVLGSQGGKLLVLLTPEQLQLLTSQLSTNAIPQPTLQPSAQGQQTDTSLLQGQSQQTQVRQTKSQPAQTPFEPAKTFEPVKTPVQAVELTQTQQPDMLQPHIQQPLSAFDPIPPPTDEVMLPPTPSSGAGKSPPRDPRPPRLPPNWKTASDADGCIYYYHVITRQTQWEAPTWDGTEEDMMGKKDADMDISTPNHEDTVKKTTEKLSATAVIASGTEQAKKSREAFRSKMSQHIVNCLSVYRKSDCKVGRILSTEDFKHLARKLTHNVLIKEIKQVQVWEDLECNSNVKHKAKEYVKKYMAKVGPVYKTKDDDDDDLK